MLVIESDEPGEDKGLWIGEEAFLENDCSDVELDSDDYFKELTKGRDVQWVDDEKAIDWGKQLIYIDAQDNDKAAKYFKDILGKLFCDTEYKFKGGNLFGDSDKVLHRPTVKVMEEIWTGLAKNGQQVAVWMKLTPKEQRALSQLAYLKVHAAASIATDWLVSYGAILLELGLKARDAAEAAKLAKGLSAAKAWKMASRMIMKDATKRLLGDREMKKIIGEIDKVDPTDED